MCEGGTAVPSHEYEGRRKKGIELNRMRSRSKLKAKSEDQIKAFISK